MKSLIAITDHEWFQFLASRPDLDEVNFWRPRDLDRPNIAPGTPFIFKLRHKYGDAIVGFAFFLRHDVLPAWRAWDVFEQANGATSFADMRLRLERLRRDPESAHGAGDYPIGCLLLSAPVFFERSAWVTPPSDWSKNIVQEKGYDTSVGEGARVWNECRLAAAASRVADATKTPLRDADLPRYGPERLIAPRLGQRSFKIAVADAYGRACAVTTEHSLPVLEAAHIRPYAEEGPHEIGNGLLLRTDIHRLFDQGYVTVTPGDHCFVVSHRLRDDYENGRTYYAMHGHPIHLPQNPADYPRPEYLQWHAEERYKG